MNRRYYFSRHPILLVLLLVLGLFALQSRLGIQIVETPSSTAIPNQVNTHTPQLSQITRPTISIAANSTAAPTAFYNQSAPVQTLSTSYTIASTDLPLPPLPTSEAIQLSVPMQPVENQIVITFNPNVSPEQQQIYLESIGATVVQTVGALNTVVVSVSPAIALQPLPASPIVSVSESDYFAVALEVPVNDPLYGQEWALPVIGAPEGWSLLEPDSPMVTVAVVDSGVCIDHPDLIGRILPGYDFVDNDNIAQDAFGHGCGVAGVIAANSNNGIGIAGVAPNTQILPVRVLNAQGVGTYSNVAAGIVYAADHGAQIINLSLGGANLSNLLENAVDYAISKGAVVVAAAGNTGSTVLYPAAYAPVIAVASVDPNLQRSSFSSYGLEVDLLAPGRDILTTSSDGNYRTMTGTSFAAPHVAGIAALELAHGRTVFASEALAVLVDLNDDNLTLQPTPTIIDSKEIVSYHIDFDSIVSVPLDLRPVIQNAIITQSNLLPSRTRGFFSTSFRTSTDGNWARIVLVADYVIDSGWENFRFEDIVELLVRKDENSEWVANLYKEQDFENLVQNVPTDFLDFSGSAVIPSSGVYHFPWTSGETWKLTQGWHPDGYSDLPDNNAVDFKSLSDNNVAVVASQGGLLDWVCDPDSHGQAWLMITNADGVTGYGHIAGNTVTKIGQPIGQGDRIGEVYNPGHQYDTPCGGGATRHIHFVFPHRTIEMYGMAAGENSYRNIAASEIGTWPGYEKQYTAANVPMINVGQISGQVLNPSNQPLQGSVVIAMSGGTSSTTNSNGVYVLNNVPPGNTMIRAEHPTWGVGTNSVNVTANTSQQAGNIVIGICLTNLGEANAEDCGDTTPPQGNFTSPSNSATVSKTLYLAGTANDASGIREVRFTAQWQGQGWHVVYADTGAPYEYTWDLCASGVPDGWIELGFDITDNAGNVRNSPNGTRLITKSGGCGTGTDITLPTGSWVSPDNGATINARTVTLQANASDNSGGSGVNQVRFSAKISNTWVGIGEAYSSPYNREWDLCASGVTKDSIVELGMEIWDNAGNKWIYSQHFTNISIRFTYDCSQNPSGNEAILYDNPDYHGEQRSFGLGKHDIGGMWNDRAHSLYVPNGWSVRLYVDGNFQGQNACFNQNTSSLPGPYAEGVSSLQVFDNGSCYDNAVPPIISCGAVILHDGGGNQLVLTNSVNNLAELGWNDKARYIEVIGPYRAIAYDSENLQGWSHGPFSTGTYTGIGTNVSSVFVEKTGDCNLPPDAPVECTAANPGVYLVDSGGQELRLTVSESNLAVRGWNDRPREMYVVGPYRATAYDSENLQGWSHGPLVHGQRQGIGTNVSSVRVEITIDCYNLPRAPETPGSFAITNTADTSLTLQWGNVANENGYKLYKWDGAAFTIYRTFGVDTSTFTDTGLICGKEYFYQVSAYNGVGESPVSGWVKGTTINCPDIESPTVALLWPEPYSSFSTDQITLYADASDEQSGVSDLQFFVFYDDFSGAGAAQLPAPPPVGDIDALGTEWHYIGTDSDGSDGWSITWNTADATYDQLLRFWVYAYDEAGNSSASSVDNIVLDRAAPFGELTAPVEGSYHAESLIGVTANAYDAFVGVAYVTFYNWTGSEWSSLAADDTAPYEFAWDVSTLPDGWQTLKLDATDYAGNTATIGWASVALDRNPPVSSVDILPVNQINLTFPVVWSGADAVTENGWLGYDVQVQDNCTGAWQDWQTNTPNVSAEFAGSYGHMYCFRSRATDLAGNVEAWPETADTMTQILYPLVAPEALVPVDQTLLGRLDPITLSWDPVPDATGYMVEFWNTNDVQLSSGWINELNWTIPSQRGGAYQWRVKAHDDLRESGWSQSQMLSVRYGTPSDLSITAYNTDQIELAWTSSIDAPDNIGGYIIDFLRDGFISRRYWAEADAVTFLTSDLDCEATYTIVVRAYQGTLESEDSNGVSVTLDECPLLAPSLYSPAHNSASEMQQFWFSWSPYQHATSYEIQIGTTNPPTTSVISVNTTYYYTPSPLLTTTYYWRVRSVRDDRASDWSEVLSFTVTSPANAAPVRNLFTTATPTLSWGTVSWAVAYEIEWSSTSAFNWWDAHYNRQRVSANTLSLETFPLIDGTYYWRVRAQKADGTWSDWSMYDAFIIDIP